MVFIHIKEYSIYYIDRETRSQAGTARLVARSLCPDGGKYMVELGRVIPSHTLQNVFCRRPTSHPTLMFKSLQLGVYQGRVTDESLGSLFNQVQGLQLEFG